ncbi:MAG: hypothetical protein M1840_003077 [Geoglossum simile]|nr:MAG: hypothetical protein M1840_003077 [Geoglossum simile]
MEIFFSLNYPDDDPLTRSMRELEALMLCEAVSEVKDPMKQGLLDVRIQCPFRKREGCMAELSWYTGSEDLRDHITEMRHGEGPSSNSNSTQTHTPPLYRPGHLADSSPSTTVYRQKLLVEGDDMETFCWK